MDLRLWVREKYMYEVGHDGQTGMTTVSVKVQ